MAMHDLLFSSTHNDALLKEKIQAIDLKMLCKKMVEHFKWDPEEVAEAEKVYRNFVFLMVKYGGKTLDGQDPADPKNVIHIVPSQDVDEFWHNHILETHKYPKDCEAICGRYLHHYPYFGIDGRSTEADSQAGFAQTQELYFKEFGTYIYDIRNRLFQYWMRDIKDFFSIARDCVRKLFSSGKTEGGANRPL